MVKRSALPSGVPYAVAAAVLAPTNWVVAGNGSAARATPNQAQHEIANATSPLAGIGIIEFSGLTSEFMGVNAPELYWGAITIP
jgi:hypothetical protein